MSNSSKKSLKEIRKKFLDYAVANYMKYSYFLPRMEHLGEGEEFADTQTVGMNLFHTFRDKEVEDLFDPRMDYQRVIEGCLESLVAKIDYACYQHLISKYEITTKKEINIANLFAASSKGMKTIMIPASIVSEVAVAIYDRYPSISSTDRMDSEGRWCISIPEIISIYQYNDFLFEKDKNKKFIFAFWGKDIAFLSRGESRSLAAADSITEKIDPKNKIKFMLETSRGMNERGWLTDIWQLRTHYQIKSFTSDMPLVLQFSEYSK